MSLYDQLESRRRSFQWQVLHRFGVRWALGEDGQILTPVPSRFLPDKRYVDEVHRLEAEIAALEALDSKEVARRARTTRRNDLKEHREYATEQSVQLYDTAELLHELRSWSAPAAYKKQRESWITVVIEEMEMTAHMVVPPGPRVTPKEWLEQEIAWRRKSILSNKVLLARSDTQAREQTARVRELLDSLGIAYSDEPVPVK